MSESRRTLLLYGAAVVIVQLLLVAGVWISAPHNGGDNAGYVSLAHSLLQGDGYVEAWDPARPLHTKYPPVFPVLLAGVIALGARTWTALKVVPAAATTVAIVLAYLWAARRRSPFFGAVLALLLAAAPGVLWYSHWVLSDVPFLAFTLLALVALERASPPDGAAPPSASRARAWLAVGFVAAVLAYFTRSAGLPLLVAVAGWLALRRRWKGLAAFALLAGAPAVAWWLRGRGGGVDYVGEFWMVDPYNPALGTVGALGLVERAVANLGLYVLRHVPEGLAGTPVALSALMGVALLGAALLGWGMRLVPSERVGLRFHVAELFFPLYGGLILLWPPVWSGDRFALPLFPLILFYAGDGLLRGARRFAERWVREGGRPTLVGAVATVAVLAVALPATVNWMGARQGARACADLMRNVGTGPYACHGPPWDDFVEASRWASANLEPGPAVLTRKPRIFYVLSGLPSRTYPFTTDPEAFLAAAAGAGARHVLLDAVDRQGIVYVGGVVRALPGAFCSVASFGTGAAGASQLLGILPPESGRGGRVEQGEGGPSIRIPPCPPPLRPATETRPPPLVGLEIPLLAGG